MKPPLIFLHGFRGNHLGLADIAKHFPDYDVHLPDLPPAGGHDLKKYDTAAYIKFVKDYITEHNLKNPILIGHSMGSIIAAATAEKYPKLLGDKLVLLAPISSRPPALIRCLSPLTVLFPHKFVTYLSSKYLFIKKSGASFERILDLSYQCGADYVNRRAVFHSAKFSSNYSIRDFHFHQSAIFIAGTKDKLVKREKTQLLADFLDANTAFIHHTGHLLNYERPARVAREIRKFIES